MPKIDQKLCILNENGNDAGILGHLRCFFFTSNSVINLFVGKHSAVHNVKLRANQEDTRALHQADPLSKKHF